MATVPIMLAGAMTVTFNLAAPADSASAAPKRPTKPKSELAKTLREILLTSAKSNASAAPPPSYTVVPGDNVSSIASRYGVSTASVLALNGLSWKSLIFPGQVLKLSTTASAAPVAPTAAPAAGSGGRYSIVRGDTISSIAARFGVTTQAVLTANGLGWSSIIYPGQTIAIPAAGAPLAITTVSSVTPSAPSTPTMNYTIVAGDTLSALAARFGTTIAAIMAANSLGSSTIIYSGRTLVIPSTVLAATTVSAVTAGAPLTDEMAANARLIIQTGQRLGVPDRGIVVALAAAMQESGLRNLDYGDRDSVGLFQQRPSTGWGTDAQLTDPAYATELFFGGPSNPNRPRTRGLLDIPGWQSMTVAQAAQAVQISAYPDAYAKWESSAWSWLAQYR
jgi:LysM repeat protein